MPHCKLSVLPPLASGGLRDIFLPVDSSGCQAHPALLLMYYLARQVQFLTFKLLKYVLIKLPKAISRIFYPGCYSPYHFCCLLHSYSSLSLVLSLVSTLVTFLSLVGTGVLDACYS